MNNSIGTALTIVALGASVAIHAAQIPPVPDNPRQAQTFFGFNIKTRCPDIRMADAGTKAVIVFWVPQRGTQLQVSLKTTSGSAELDAAAMSCVSKLRFAPATTVGDGEAIDSWQQISLSWADPAKAYAIAAGSQNPSPGAYQATAMTPARSPSSVKSGAPASQGSSVTVHVCVDDKGKLEQEPTIVQSSGVAAVDQAAIKIAAAGSAYYHPHASSTTPPKSSCAQLAIEFDTK